MLRSTYAKSFDDVFQKWLKHSRFLKHIVVTKELYLLLFFLVLFLILFLRLFILQVVRHNHYDNLLNQQHVSETSLKAKRGNIFADDKAQKHIQLTDTISLYNLYVDPKFVRDKEAFINVITPSVYTHFCELYGMKEVTPMDCIKHLEIFTQKQLLPPTPQFFYL
jgi:cell division protein FtsI/penicillin-binding protein 2